MPHPLDADEFTTPIKLPEVSMFWTIDQVAQILGVNRAWIRSNSVGMDAGVKPNRSKLRVVNLTPGKAKPTYRVKNTELQRFLSVRNIPYS